MVAGVLTSAVAAAVLAAAGTVASAAHTGSDASGSVEVRAEGRFAPPTSFVPSAAITYEQELVPAASWIEVKQRSDQHGTRVSLRVKGLHPGHAYGVHVHQKPCGANPAAAGPHYQNEPGPMNPENEVWLDFTAGKDGSGKASASHNWGFRRGEAAAVVLHREQGGAGDRLACFSVPFAPSPVG
ncbi:superoxide dismutase family protein [Streptomyces spectabilis]|uniref:Superoxide dismutase family protein n=1 Tax=Streptomyces spectabilis TaxID=68270 RepID=A0A516R6N6_STRST|nr:superoxide dismutase family protein [Streptomyces spectabilis]QDQ11326.1 superoxide dismutase family protein [Streptomyces spectabilis]